MHSDQKVNLIIRSSSKFSVYVNKTSVSVLWLMGCWLVRRWDDALVVAFKWVHCQKLNVLPCYHPLLWTRTSGLNPSSFLLDLHSLLFMSVWCSGVQSHLSFSLLMDPVSELDYLCVDARAILPRAALTPAHNSCQKPPSATLQTH